MVPILKTGIVANSSSLHARSRGTMPDAGPHPGAAKPSSSSRAFATVALALGVAVAAVLAFAAGIADEPPFVDESAMISQSYFADLLLRGDRDNPAWLEYPGYDSSPLPKYLIGMALRFGGY